MKKLLLVLAAITCLSGCTVYDAMFSGFGDHYSGGGTNLHEKQAHYDASVESYGR